MARIRSVKPEFWEDEQIGLLSRDARLLYIATWNLADDEGLLRWAASYLKASVFMYDDELGVAEVAALMEELETSTLVFPYVGGKAQQRLGWIPNFHKHQHPNRPQPSKFPPPSLQNPFIRTAYGDRDGWICHVCHGEIPRTGFGNFDREGPSLELHILSIDHLVPRVKGGHDYPSNIGITHRQCNSRKGMSEWPPDALTAEDTESFSESFTPGGEGRGEESSSGIADVAAILGRRDFDAARDDGVAIRAPGAYLTACVESRILVDGATIRRLFDEHPGWDASRVADHVDDGHDGRLTVTREGAVTVDGRTFLPGTGWVG